jgi:hypothetical protein
MNNQYLKKNIKRQLKNVTQDDNDIRCLWIEYYCDFVACINNIEIRDSKKFFIEYNGKFKTDDIIIKCEDEAFGAMQKDKKMIVYSIQLTSLCIDAKISNGYFIPLRKY